MKKVNRGLKEEGGYRQLTLYKEDIDDVLISKEGHPLRISAIYNHIKFFDDYFLCFTQYTEERGIFATWDTYIKEVNDKLWEYLPEARIFLLGLADGEMDFLPKKKYLVIKEFAEWLASRCQTYTKTKYTYTPLSET